MTTHYTAQFDNTVLSLNVQSAKLIVKSIDQITYEITDSTIDTEKKEIRFTLPTGEVFDPNQWVSVELNLTIDGEDYTVFKFASAEEWPEGVVPYDGSYSITVSGDMIVPTARKALVQDLALSYDHTAEDALIQNTASNEYVNDRVTYVKRYSFCETNIKVIKLPNVSNIDNSAFDGINNSNVEEIYMPNCVTYGTTSFQRNPKLKIVDFGKGNINTNGRISSCPMLTTLILRNESNLIEPIGATAIQNCPFAPDGTGGYVYVPQAMLASYQNSTNWQNYANVIEFRPIEGSPYELTE